MAQYQAIAGVTNSVKALLERARTGTEFEGLPIVEYQGSDFKVMADGGVSLYVYRVVVSTVRRTFPARPSPAGQPMRRPLPVDINFLVTPWAATAEKQQRILGWIMRTLEDTPILPSGLLRTAVPEPDAFRADETVELVFEPVSLQDMNTLWQALKLAPQLSATYVARALAIESKLPLAELPHVQTRGFDMGEVQQP